MFKYIITFIAIMTMQSMSSYASNNNMSKSENSKNGFIKKASEYLLGHYKNNKIIILGSSNHTQYGMYKIFDAFLDQIQLDDKLRYIFLERSFLHDKFLKKISNHRFSEIKNINDEDRNSLCSSREWAYFASKFFDKLFKINQKRKNKILLRSFDGTSLKNEQITEPLESTDCPQSQYVDYDYDSSFEREYDSASNFSKIYKTIDEKKAIIIYNVGHLLKNAKSCKVTKVNSSYREKEGLLDTWLSIYLENNQELAEEIFTVLFDEIDSFEFEGRFYHTNPKGILSIKNTSRENNFIFDLKGIHQRVHFYESSILYTHTTNLTFDHKSIDGYIWLESFGKYRYKPTREYLPQFCDNSNGI